MSWLIDTIRVAGGVILGAAAIAPFFEAGKMRFQWKYVAKENIKWIGYGLGAVLTIFSGSWVPLLVGAGIWFYNRSEQKKLGR
jgi:hypothetical protein